MGRQVSLKDLLDARKVNHCVRSRQKRYLSGKRDFYPWSVEIHPTAKCNYDCVYCAYKERNASNHVIPEEMLKALYDTFKINRVKGVFFAGGGEPLLYPPIADHIVYLNRIGIETALLTNGSLLTHEKFNDMIGALNYIAVSVPSLDDKDFLRVTGRKMPHFLADLPNLISAGRRKVPIIGARLVAAKENYTTVVETALKLKGSGWDYCIVKIPKDPEGRGIGLSEEEISCVRQAYEKSASELPEDFTNLGTNLGTALEGTEKIRPSGDVCWAIEYAVNCFIHTDGGVYLCLPLLGRKEYCIGNIKEENFDDIWKGLRRREVIEKMHSRYRAMECSGCRNIQYSNIIEGYPESGFSKDMDPFL